MGALEPAMSCLRRARLCDSWHRLRELCPASTVRASVQWHASSPVVIALPKAAQRLLESSRSTALRLFNLPVHYARHAPQYFTMIMASPNKYRAVKLFGEPLSMQETAVCHHHVGLRLNSCELPTLLELPQKPSRKLPTKAHSYAPRQSSP